jgi:hypothetical protein
VKTIMQKVRAPAKPMQANVKLAAAQS